MGTQHLASRDRGPGGWPLLATTALCERWEALRCPSCQASFESSGAHWPGEASVRVALTLGAQRLV